MGTTRGGVARQLAVVRSERDTSMHGRHVHPAVSMATRLCGTVLPRPPSGGRDLARTRLPLGSACGWCGISPVHHPQACVRLCARCFARTLHTHPHGHAAARVVVASHYWHTAKPTLWGAGVFEARRRTQPSPHHTSQHKHLASRCDHECVANVMRCQNVYVSGCEGMPRPGSAVI